MVIPKEVTSQESSRPESEQENPEDPPIPVSLGGMMEVLPLMVARASSEKATNGMDVGPGEQDSEL